MKTKTNLLRLLTGLFFLPFVQINISSEELELRSSEVMYYSFIYEYPVNTPSGVDLSDWMVYPCDFNNSECYDLYLDWFGDESVFTCVYSNNYWCDCELWSFLESATNHSDETPLMQWMLGFESMVVDQLLKDVQPDILEEWMYDTDNFLDFEDSSLKMTDWMLAENLGVVKSQLEFESWMIRTFTVN